MSAEDTAYIVARGNDPDGIVAAVLVAVWEAGSSRNESVREIRRRAEREWLAEHPECDSVLDGYRMEVAA